MTGGIDRSDALECGGGSGFPLRYYLAPSYESRKMIEQKINIVGTSQAVGEVSKHRCPAEEGLSLAVESVAKRVFDVAVSLAGLVLLGPLFLFIGLLVKLDSPGPIFYRGQRVGKDGRPFWMYKFRTMEDVPADTGPRITARDDPRITHVGRILRDTKLNELPQVINVLKGEMSLVGPRPEDPKYVALYTPEQRRVLSVPPGITSIASIVYRDEENMLSHDTLEDTYVNVIMSDKLRLDLEYIDHRSFLVDMDIILRTFLVLLPRFTQAAPEIEELLFGPVQCFIRRRLSWFTLDLILGFVAVSTASLVWWRAMRPVPMRWPLGVVSTAAMALTFTLMNQICGLQRSMWSCAGAQEVFEILLSTVFSITLLLAISALAPLEFPFPLGMIALSGFLAWFAFTAARYRSRLVTGGLWHWRSPWAKARREGRQRVLIVGAGEVGQSFAWQIQRRWEGRRYQIVGFVDDDLTKRGMRIHGVDVLGRCRAIPTLVERYGVDVVVVTTRDLQSQECQAIVGVCRRTPAQVRVIPDVLQLICQPSRALAGEVGEGDVSSEYPIDSDDGLRSVSGRADVVMLSPDDRRPERLTPVWEPPRSEVSLSGQSSR
jgi:lipopolysaccharide/colanic/teichoic acid biosynthesis glycosyltransferase